ncbi:enoyl-CoA hydratase/isomerase family protein [Thalassotalea euphylliae]|uniref:Enoyl-CoA hydratase/isomerase family protein n=1 Tax=Thalassotalea euphylliae TaxID=1655234 RepID=A0A3E0UGA9_9GAMM|nr:enoyl-CoA hydratase/isomerase family protein [Thalassotalea euphylliae]REL36081.1 enoyl-CoA hydratase/isomerase family protein [Thalassotalea euphylliae]
MSIQVHSHIANHIATIAFTSPEHHFMTLELLEAIQTALAKVARDPQVRVIILTNSTPGYFITHYSLDEINQHMQQVRKIKALTGPLFPLSVRLVMAMSKAIVRLDRFSSLRNVINRAAKHNFIETTLTYARVNRFLQQVRNSQKPVIASIGGNAQGFGMELAMACDFRVMAKGDYYLGQIESLIGLMPGSGGMHSLARLIGEAKAIELCMLGSRLTADEAEQLGLIYQAVDETELVEASGQLAAKLANKSPLSISYIKRGIHKGHDQSFSQALAQDEVAFVDTASTDQAAKAYQHQRASLAQGKTINTAFDHQEISDINEK